MTTLLNKFEGLLDLNIGKTFLSADGLPYKYIRTTPVSNEKVEIEIEVNYQRIIFRSNVDRQQERIDYFVKLSTRN